MGNFKKPNIYTYPSTNLKLTQNKHPQFAALKLVYEAGLGFVQPSSNLP